VVPLPVVPLPENRACLHGRQADLRDARARPGYALSRIRPGGPASTRSRRGHGCPHGVIAGGGEATLEPLATGLLAVWDEAGRQIAELDRRLRALARHSVVCRRLMTVPGVGAITALSFVAVIDDPRRFAKSSGVGAYLGLTPKRHQPGEVDDAGRISRWADGGLRGYLYEAAVVLLFRQCRASILRVWGLRLVERIGIKKACVALARKLAVTLHAMGLAASDFRPGGDKTAA
jgi:transposase